MNRDMIQHGMTCGDVMTNSFTFSHESPLRGTDVSVESRVHL